MEYPFSSSVHIFLALLNPFQANNASGQTFLRFLSYFQDIHSISNILCFNIIVDVYDTYGVNVSLYNYVAFMFIFN